MDNIIKNVKKDGTVELTTQKIIDRRLNQLKRGEAFHTHCDVCNVDLKYYSYHHHFKSRTHLLKQEIIDLNKQLLESLKTIKIV